MNKRAIGALIVVLMVVVVAVAGFYLTRADDSGKINATTVPVGVQKDSIKEGKIDGGVLWDPYASDALLSGDAEALIWSGDFWKDHPCCIIAVDNDFAEKNPDAVVAFLAGQIRSLAWIENALADKNSEDYKTLVDIVYKHSKVSESVMLEALEHMDFKIDMNNDVFGEDRGFNDWLEYYTEQFIDLGVLTERQLNNAGYKDVESFVNDLVDSTYLEKAYKVNDNFVLENEVSIRIGQLAGDLHQLALVVSLDKRAGNGEKSILEMMNIKPITDSPFNAGGDIMSAFMGDKLDIAYVGSPPTIQFSINSAKDLDVSIIACANVNGSALVVKSGMFDKNMTIEEKVQGLADKTIGVPGTASIQYLMLLSIAEEYDMEVTL